MSITSVPKYPGMTRTVSPIVSNNSTSNRDIPMDSNTGTSKPVVPITSDTGTSKPVFPITSDTGTSKPVFPITSDTGTSKPIVPMASSTDNSACNSSSTSRKRHRLYDDFVENCSKKIYEVVNDNILNAFGPGFHPAKISRAPRLSLSTSRRAYIAYFVLRLWGHFRFSRA